MKPGDTVKLITSEGTFEGTLLPRPALLSSDITVLKLTTGYNIGIETKKIKKSTVLLEYEMPIPVRTKISYNPELPTVAILSTGGTIASRIDYRTGGVYADYSAEDFVAMCPELSMIANIKAVKVMSIMSEDAVASDWQAMAQNVIDALKNSDGVVITHGTDTMHFTASALSFLLENLNKPVIITGSQRSIDRGSSDAFMNLTCAVKAAASWDGACVAICMHGTISDEHCTLLRGTKVRKMHTSRRDAFRAINDQPLARVYTDGQIEITNPDYPKRREGKITLRKIENAVALVQIHPDLDPGIIDYHVKQKVKGLVLNATAFGHVPINREKTLGPSLKKAIAAGITIVVCSQTVYGRVNPYVYTNLRKLSMDIGAIYLSDMLSETAFTKLMVALTYKNTKEFMESNIAGEFTSRELEREFLQ
ncbi:MAG TPA: Glu-tRNA(Gln) amidotransferase subunit GatD [Candidatus Nanoarchaeia archaeon]|nr:Glu-tRNA(Gln) amidotransferase subunit GatD [Candidatus Nanoarchaeia archaeon]